ncbi:hypothetical protein GF337_13915 [candidate division KSB1 bacterium]|nr:hypothetical protein [candidate division KSB1 bacterium]
MKIYLFSNENSGEYFDMDSGEINRIIDKVAHETNTNDLVMALYFLRKSPWIGGTYFRNWMNPDEFITGRGRWKITKKFDHKIELPWRYKLIRILFDLKMKKYPLIQNDRYGWVFRYESFSDHLAFITAHELHHFRRYHLDMHRKEGEHSANRWALAYVNELGFSVSGKKKTAKKKKRFNHYIFSKTDPYEKFRNLKTGAKLLIHHDPNGRYLNEYAVVMRPIRNNSKRIVIKTADGKAWRWPMEWLTVLS